MIDAITDITEDVVINGTTHYSPMQFLTRFLFSPADQQKYISTLSGGEMRRLHLAAVLITQPNFLILDEPTNDLDIMTLGILEEYLREFKGCVIVISHDRFFLDSIVDHLFVMEGGGVIKDFPETILTTVIISKNSKKRHRMLPERPLRHHRCHSHSDARQPGRKNSLLKNERNWKRSQKRSMN